ncbi:bifunctional diguanylate cyclase/phosphodiesterase [Psychrobium sp. 1_MG-2023]|uniref:putative bifunctional diguanylate cyclase/phosphodiesterase n=1 Tax=Psychrobium sp. 1_MG-2023 TaxID=3062624 RepID=UPI0026C8D339|nr:GGDEF domain-containing phosphodiesterase [Psychrobium sp. 1_MG-2023]MDP2560676.1 EAL domain-containing protein [Psychrobium sp. 1_MG-2023]
MNKQLAQFFIKSSTFFSSIQRVNQLRLVMKLLFIALSLLAIRSFSADVITPSAYALTASLVVVIGLYYLITPDTTNIITAMLLWGLIILTVYILWNNSGLYNSAIIVLPCLMVISVMLTSRLIYIPMLLFIIATLVFLSYAKTVGLITPVLQTDDGSYWARSIDMSVIIIFFTLNAMFFANDFQLLLRKITKKNKTLANELANARQRGNYDQLTELPNEQLCNENLSGLIAQASASGDDLAFITLDIHHLRSINNTFGHSVGNQLLVEIAKRLRTLETASTSVYHFQGNEFVILKECHDHQEAIGITEQIFQAITLPFRISEYDIEVSGAIGVATAPFDGSDLDTLRKKSHIALYNVSSDLGYQFFEQEMASIAAARYQLAKALKQAIKNQEFELYYQPKVDLTDGDVIGAEALIRWNRPDFGMVSPDVFITLAEESGLITEITRWISLEATKACKEWHNLGFPHLSIAINLSVSDFKRGNLPQLIFKALNQAGLAAHFLELELTESMLIDDINHIQTQVQELHNKGISFAIDDFGTGYSNLGYLTKFNVSTLKIDQSFVRQVNESEHDYHIIKAIIQMSESLGIINVAEGIEDEKTMNKLANLNCQIGQGYLWSKPLPADQFIQFLTSTTTKTRIKKIN